MRGKFLRTFLLFALASAVVSMPATGADQTNQTKKNNTTKQQLINGNIGTVIKNGQAQTKTNVPNKTASVFNPPKPAPPPKNAPVVKGDAAACVKLVLDKSGFFLSPYYRARNVCARRVRLWVFDANGKNWRDSVIVESREDATLDDYDGMQVSAGQVVAACTMSGDSTPPGCFSKVAGGLYAITSNNVILH